MDEGVDILLPVRIRQIRDAFDRDGGWPATGLRPGRQGVLLERRRAVGQRRSDAEG